MQIILKMAIYVKVPAFAEAVKSLLVQLNDIHAQVLARRQASDISVWQQCLEEIQGSLRGSLLRMPNRPLDQPHAYEVYQTIRSVAHMVLDCRNAVEAH